MLVGLKIHSKANHPCLKVKYRAMSFANLQRKGFQLQRAILNLSSWLQRPSNPTHH